MTDTLTSWLSRIEKMHPSAIDMGLERVRQVWSIMAMPKPEVPIVVIAGTNGKGTTAFALSYLLYQHGYKVGLYSSPHLECFNERIQINHQSISDEGLCQAFERVAQASGNIPLTFFEFTTLAAFWIFSQAALDVWVMEVGLGGRLDAVNLLDADLAIITSIGIDHVEWLGKTREAIAIEKIGVCRAHTKVICGDIDPPTSMVHELNKRNLEVLWRGSDFGFTQDKSLKTWGFFGIKSHGATYEYKALSEPCLPKESLSAAMQAAFWLFPAFKLSKELLENLGQWSLLGRQQWVNVKLGGKTIKVCMDVAHNPHAAEFLVKQWRQNQIRFSAAILGMLTDKPSAEFVKPLIPLVSQWITVNLPTNRSCSAESLAKSILSLGILARSCDNVSLALETLGNSLSEGDTLLISGSFYTVSEAIQWLNTHHSNQTGQREEV